MAATKKKRTTKKVAPKAKKKPAPKKRVVAKKRPVARKTKKAATKRKKRAVRRFDRPGHLDPRYVKELRARTGRTTKHDQTRPAFRVADDDVAEELGEGIVGKATTGEDEGEDLANADFVEEVGGPFVVTTGREEFAEGVDESNPPDAEREPFPIT